MSSDEPHGPGQPGPSRLYLWIALLVAGAIGVWLMFQLFPGQTFDEWDRANLIWALVLLTALSTAVLTARQFKWRETARNIAIWGGVVVVLVIGYTYQDELGTVWRRVKGEFVPGSAIETGANVVTLTEQDGHFYVFGDVGGTQVKFLIDTGASDVVLSPDDARRAGIDVDSLTFVAQFETANGIGEGARVTLDNLAVGPIRLRRVDAFVNRAPMRTSLLGMSFLRRLDGFEFQGRRLLLKWH